MEIDLMKGTSGMSSELGRSVSPRDAFDLAKLNDMLFETLSEVVRVVTEASTSYFVAYGTAIGAVRDRDLIEWDTDVDLLVPAELYDKLVNTLSTNLDSKYRLWRPGDEGYGNLFCRVAPKGIPDVYVHVDLFPLSAAPAGKFLKCIYRIVQRSLYVAYFVRQADLQSRNHYTRNKRLLFRCAHCVLRAVPAGWLTGRFKALRDRSWSHSNSRSVLTNSCGAYGFREFFDACWFGGVREGKIRNLSVALPVGYDEMLKMIYGNYLVEPSDDDKRKLVEFKIANFVEPLRNRALI